MRNILIKEIKLSSSVLSYLFIVFGFMFLIPGYPILCGVFFSTLGLFKSFEFAREANDTVFSALLPIAKKDVVKGRYCFVVLIELCTAILMLISILLRMTVFVQSSVYRNNVMMNANLFALGAAFVLYGLFNLIFVGGFFKTAYKTARPFLVYMIVAFLVIGIFEAVHYFPHMEIVNAFGMDNFGLQLYTMCIGIVIWVILTVYSCRKSCYNFERIDL